MSLKVVSQIKYLAAAGVAALVIGGPAVASERADVIERIKPVGQVFIEGQARPAEPVAAAAAPTVPDAAPAEPAKPMEPGEALYAEKGCTACHGAEGRAPIMSAYPKVASLPEPYIVNQLKDIKSGARNNGQSVVMKGIMANVSDDDMQVIAGWLSKLPR